MIKEDKQILLEDLCARLPYGVKASVIELNDEDGSQTFTDCMIKAIRKNQLVEFIRIDGEKEIGRTNWHDISLFTHYLRPMSSMTKEEKQELLSIIREETNIICEQLKNHDCGIEEGKYHFNSILELEFLLSHHFDYCGLIQKGLALEAPEGMYKID